MLRACSDVRRVIRAHQIMPVPFSSKTFFGLFCVRHRIIWRYVIWTFGILVQQWTIKIQVLTFLLLGLFLPECDLHAFELISSNYSFTKFKIRLRSKCSEYALHSICSCLTLLDLVAILCTTSWNVQKFLCLAHIVHLSNFVISEQCLFPC